jgi:hypothetical protein
MAADPRILLLAAALGAGTSTGPATAQDRPLSAIDWLSDSIDTEVLPPIDEPATSPGLGTETIAVTPLGEVSQDAVGLLPSSVTGLPRDLWGATPSHELAEEFARLREGLLPAMQELLFTLLLAELDPPADSDPRGALFLARIDTLMSLGAVEQAQALLERSGTPTAAAFERLFDATLLTGTENRACEVLRAKPDLAPGLAAQIFCLARNKDWNAAVVTLETGRALGELSGAEEAILARFLDPELFEDAPLLPPPARPSPLVFRLYEAIGEPIPTGTLPLPFAQADLLLNSAWKAQIEAAERLARSGALDANRLLGLYTERQPAASGGVWDRVAAVQRLEAALAENAPQKVADALMLAWAALGEAGLQPVLARLYAERLAGVALEGEAKALAFELALLSPRYEAAALAHDPADARERFLSAVARGEVSGAAPHDATAEAVADGFAAAAPPERLAALVRDGDLGAAILRAIRMGADGANGDLDKISGAIALFRAIGLEDIARRYALQAMLLVEDA